MTAVEIHFRLLALRGQILHISEDLEDIEQSLKEDGALRLLERASNGLSAVERDLCSIATLENPEAMLRLSVSLAPKPRPFQNKEGELNI